MTEWKKCRADNEPLDVDSKSSPTTVYLHRNAVEVEVEDNGEKRKEWNYEEKTMTQQEYAVYLAEQNSAAIDDMLIAQLGE